MIGRAEALSCLTGSMRVSVHVLVSEENEISCNNCLLIVGHWYCVCAVVYLHFLREHCSYSMCMRTHLTICEHHSWEYCENLSVTVLKDATLVTGAALYQYSVAKR